jgi:hypothetical protein
MKLIHIYRDPRDVAASFLTKDWGNQDIKGNLIWIQDVLDRWEEIKAQIPKDSYYELPFEYFIANLKKSLIEICKFLKISFSDHMMTIDISNHNIGRWKKNLSKKEIEFINKNYSPLLQKYRYL